MDTHYDVIVIGGGPAGMMASIFATKNKKSVLIIDHNEKLGKKLFITGKGRCNITNNSSVENHLLNIMRNPKFMYSALHFFGPQDVMQFFLNSGLKITTERGNRVFPTSNKSSDVIKVLERTLFTLGVHISLNTEVISIEKTTDKFYISCSGKKKYTADSIVAACGGASYRLTGSDASIWKIIERLGHSIINPHPALTRIIVNEDLSNLKFLELKNVRLSITVGKQTYSSEGEMAFADNMIIGPIALTLSSYITGLDLKDAKCELDLKIGLNEDQIEAKLLREFALNPKKKLYNYLNTIIPHGFVGLFVNRFNLVDKNLGDITKKERLIIIDGIKHFPFKVTGLDDIDRAIITSGGVNVKEIDSKTMESKLIKGLYFAGEVIDVDALTGGYNLQIAWSTGALAGSSIK